MHDPEGDSWIVYNGEFYGFRSSRDLLSARGHRFHSKTDTEVVLHLYREHGDDFLDRVDGMFGFALWDERRRRLFVARDRIGIKPVYYYQKDDVFIAASEIPAILAAGPEIDRTIDVQAVHNYLSLNYIPAPRTIYRRIRKLPAGHKLIWEDGVIRIERFWDVSFRREPSDAPAPEEAEERVMELLEDAVRRRLIADVPLGLFLSGGVDSSAMASIMARLSSGRVKTFTIDFEERSYSEASCARFTSKLLDTEHREMKVCPQVEDLIPEIIDGTGEPFADSSAIPVWYLSRMTREHVTVALGGDGGDELFAGYEPHRAYRLASLYRRLPPMLRDHLIPWAVDRLPVSHAKTSFDFKARQFVRSAASAPEAAHYGFKEFLDETQRGHILAPCGDTLAPTYADVFEPYVGRAMEFIDPLDRILYLDHKIYLADDILTKLDRMSMAHSLEARVPLLDHRLVEYVASLPSRYKLHHLSGKWIFKRALSRLLPRETLRRKKAGFNVPMASWLNRELRATVDDHLSSSRLRRMELVEPHAVRNLVERHRRREADLSRPIWALMLLSAWSERIGGVLPCHG